MSTRLYEQCLEVYGAMHDKAVHVPEQSDKLVYTGYLTYLFEERLISIGAYTPVMRRLQAMGCVCQEVAGGRNTPSQWRILDVPTEEAFASSKGTRKSRLKALEERVAALEEEVRSA